MQHLALEVRQLDRIGVHQPERADAGGGEVERGRRAEAPHADHHDARPLQPALALETDVREREVPGVASQLAWGEFGRKRGRHSWEI